MTLNTSKKEFYFFSDVFSNFSIKSRSKITSKFCKIEISMSRHTSEMEKMNFSKNVMNQSEEVIKRLKKRTI